MLSVKRMIRIVDILSVLNVIRTFGRLSPYEAEVIDHVISLFEELEERGLE